MESESTLGLLFEIGADPSKGILAVQSFSSEASKALGEFEQKIMSTMTNSLGITKEFAVGMSVGIGAVVGLGAALFELAEKAAETGAKIYETSEKTGIAADKLSGLLALSKETGENFDSLSTALARAGVNLEKAIINPGAQSSHVLAQVMGGAQALADEGLKPMGDRLQDVLKHIFAMNDVGERNLALQTLLGRGWQTNVESLKLLAEQGYGPAIEQAKKFGIFFDEESARKAKAFTIEWEQTKLTFESVAKMVGSNLIPFFSAVLSNIMVQMEYLPQYGSLLTDIVTSNSKKFEQDKKNWKSLGDVIKEVDDQVQHLVKVSTTPVETGKVLTPKDTGDAARKAEAKRLIDEHLADVQKGADSELKISEALDKQLIDFKKASHEKLNAEEEALLKKQAEYETSIQTEALNKWGKAQEDALHTAMAATAKLTGATSSEYVALFNKLTDLNRQYAEKKAAIDASTAKNVEKTTDDMVAAHDHAEKEFAEIDAHTQNEITQHAHDAAIKQIQNIIAVGKTKIDQEKSLADSQLKIVEDGLKKQLQAHKLNTAQFNQQVAAADKQWFQEKTAILNRQLAAAKASYGVESAEYKKLIAEKEKLDQEYADKSIHDQKAITETKLHMYAREEAAAIGAIQGMLGNLKQSHAMEVAMILARGAIKAQEEIAAALAASAIPGMQWSAALHYASAAAYMGLAGFSAATQGGGGGGSSSGSSSVSLGGGSSSAAAPSSSGPVRMAPGASQAAPSGTVHVIVSGSDERVAAHVTGMINGYVRNRGGMLVATHNGSGGRIK